MMPESGNDEQRERSAEVIAGKLLDKFVASHPELKQVSAGERLLQWLPLIIAVGTAFWTLAIQSKQVEQNAADIRKLEARSDQSQVTMQSVDSRLARIETMLDIITGNRQGRANARSD